MAKVLSRIYRLGEKSRVVEGDELPREVRGMPPRKFFEMNLRHNFEKCYTVCTDLVASGWFFWYSYLYTVMITIFFGGKLGILGEKLLFGFFLPTYQRFSIEVSHFITKIFRLFCKAKSPKTFGIKTKYPREFPNESTATSCPRSFDRTQHAG